MTAADHQRATRTLWPVRTTLLVFAAYYVGAELGFALTFQPRPISALWAPNAILLAALLLTPARSWWMILAAALPAHMIVELGQGVPLPMVMSWFVSNSAEALIGAALVRRYIEQPVRFDRIATVGIFLIFAGLLSPFLTSFLDAALVSLNNWGLTGYWDLVRIRFPSNVLAEITVVPVIVAWARSGLPRQGHEPLARWAEASVMAVGLLAVSYVAYGRQAAGPDMMPAQLYAPLPFLLWATVRFGPRGASTSLLVVVLLSAWSAVHGYGPFVTSSAEANAFTIQLLFIVVAITILSLSAMIEERSHAQESARRKGEQLELALDAAQLGTWDWHLEDDHAEWSPEARRILGFASDDSHVSLAQLLDAIHATDRPAVENVFKRAIESGAPYAVKFRVLGPDGANRWVQITGKVLSDVTGRPRRLIGVLSDITERVMGEALRAGENQILSMIAAGAPLNDILTALVSLAEAEFPGLLCAVMLLDVDGVHVRHGAARSLPQSYIDAIEGAKIGPRVGSCGTAMYLRKSVISVDIMEDPLWEDYRDLARAHGLRAAWSTPIMSQQGNVLGSFAMYYREPHVPSRGETELIETATKLAAIAIERQRAETEVHRQRHELAHLGRVVMLGQFSGALAHELNQPLTAILINAQAAQRLLDSTPPRLPDLREILNDIVTADGRAREVIRNLRTMLSKGEQEQVTLDLNDVTSQTIQLARTDLAAREVSVALQLMPGLPSVLGNRVQLQQVILNLIVNACDAMAAVSAAERHLRVVTRALGHYGVELSITDRGTGIPDGLVDRVFEPFVTSKQQGLGLGLSICRSIVSAHRGSLWSANNADGGATFRLVLPAAAADRLVGKDDSNLSPDAILPGA